MDATLRPATPADLQAINDIYNHYVGYCTCTYQETPETLADRERWFHRHDDRHPVVVAEAAGEVLGWGALSSFRERSAFRYTVEDSVYIKHSAQGRGLGSLLLRDLIDRATALRHQTIVAAIDSGQVGSLKLHERHGFVETGRLHRAGLKFGRWLDVVFLQYMLPAPPEIDPANMTTSCKV
jgi:L-amino acid N-acyltransferase